MRVTVWVLMGAGGNCHEHMQDTPLHFFAFLGFFSPTRSVCHGPLRQQAPFRTCLALFRVILLYFGGLLDIEHDELRVSVLFACSSVRYSGDDKFRVCLVFLLFRSTPNVFLSVMSWSRWRPSGWKRHSRHHQVGERRGCAGALRLDHHGFGSRCQLCSQDTHWLHFSVLDTLHEYEAITTLSSMPGQAALREESGCSHRKALPRQRSSAPSTSSSSCRSLPLRVYHRRSERHTQTGKTYDICTYSSLRSIPVVRGAAAAAACWRSAWVAQALKTHARNLLLHICLASFCHEGRYFSPLHEGFALCFVRHVSAHHSMVPLFYRLMGNSTSLSVHCCGMFDVFFLDLLLSCGTSLDSAFLERGAPLPDIETQESLWNVSDVTCSLATWPSSAASRTGERHSCPLRPRWHGYHGVLRAAPNVFSIGKLASCKKRNTAVGTESAVEQRKIRRPVDPATLPKRILLMEPDMDYLPCRPIYIPTISGGFDSPVGITIRKHHVFLEPDDLYGDGYLPCACFWTVLLSALLHTGVGLKRTWDQKLSSGLTSGHLDVAITDLMLLTHMTIHLFQFSFVDTEQYSLRPPPTLINWWPSWWITFDAVRAPSRSLRSV